MTIVQNRRHRDEFAEAAAQAFAAPPRPAEKPFHSAYPGASRNVLDELRAETAAPKPTALRNAFDRPVHTWLPNVGLRSVPLTPGALDDIETTTADLARLAAAAKYVPLPIRIRIAAIVEQLAEVA